MGDFKKNPKAPFVIQVPNKIRKRIAMHEKAEVSRQREVKSPMERLLSLSSKPVAKKHGSLWSRFISRVARILQIKPNGVRK